MFENVYYEGIVFDSTGQNPLKNCKVVLSASYRHGGIGSTGFEVGDTFTDKTGRFSIFGEAARSNNYDISVTRGQTTKSIYIHNVSAKELKFDFCRILILK